MVAHGLAHAGAGAPAGAAADEAVLHSAARIRAVIGPRVPAAAVLLGSGWGEVAGAVRDSVDIPYAELPAFPVPGVGGHAAVLRLGTLRGVGEPGAAHGRESGGAPLVALLLGRQHPYETGETAAMAGAVRTMAALGCRTLVQTNAAGSLDPAMPPGRFMVLADHLNLPQRSPLVGQRGDSRFVDMSQAYDPALRALAQRCAARLGLPLHEGVYAWVLGPQFETPAEIRMLRTLGAQAVGMSTVPETILARHAGMRVLALSMITNLASGLSAERLSHAHTLAGGRAAAADAVRLVQAILSEMEP